MLGWLVERATDEAGEGRPPVRLSAWSVDRHHLLERLLAEAGFEPGLLLIHRALHLDKVDLPDSIALPENYTIRSVEPSTWSEG